SYDNGETWSEAEEIVAANDFGVKNIMSVSMLRMLDGDIGLFFIIKQTPGFKNRPIHMRSSDEGKTFRFVCECGPEEYWVRMGMNNARVIRLSSGRIIYPLSIHPGQVKAKGIEAITEETAGRFEFSEELGYFDWHKSPHLEGKRASPQTVGTVMYSDDDGYTWHKSPDTVCPPFTDTEKGIQEGEIIEISPGVLKIFWRTDRMYQYEALSFDNGIHWTAAQPSCFTANCSPITIERNPYNGKIYAIWNPIPLYNGRERGFVDSGRTPLCIAETNDDLSAFGAVHNIEDDPKGAYAYAATLFLSETELLLSYCAGLPDDRHGLSRMSIAKIKIDPTENDKKEN
ncbi:MAG: exo-alpha-sialidase, partial [Clostridia bacterium]|nr:exo-alpha-sialidase [Clostridia bacterium]